MLVTQSLKYRQLLVINMAPGLLSDHTESTNGVAEQTKPVTREPLKLSGSLDRYEFDDTTPVIGREFPTLNIVDDILNAPNADELIKDLAVTSTSNTSPKRHSRTNT